MKKMFCVLAFLTCNSKQILKITDSISKPFRFQIMLIQINNPWHLHKENPHNGLKRCDVCPFEKSKRQCPLHKDDMQIDKSWHLRKDNTHKLGTSWHLRKKNTHKCSALRKMDQRSLAPRINCSGTHATL